MGQIEGTRYSRRGWSENALAAQIPQVLIGASGLNHALPGEVVELLGPDWDRCKYYEHERSWAAEFDRDCLPVRSAGGSVCEAGVEQLAVGRAAGFCGAGVCGAAGAGAEGGERGTRGDGRVRIRRGPRGGQPVSLDDACRSRVLRRAGKRAVPGEPETQERQIDCVLMLRVRACVAPERLGDGLGTRALRAGSGILPSTL